MRIYEILSGLVTEDAGDYLGDPPGPSGQFNNLITPTTAQPAATPTAQPAATSTAQPAATPTAQPAATPTAQPAATPIAQQHVDLYRGLSQPANKGQPVGTHWAVDPHYALDYTQGTTNLFHARVPKQMLSDPKYNSGFGSKYFSFRGQDPPNVRQMPQQEVAALRSSKIPPWQQGASAGNSPENWHPNDPSNVLDLSRPAAAPRAQPTATPTTPRPAATTPMGRGGGGFVGDLDPMGNPITKLGVGTHRPTKID